MRSTILLLLSCYSIIISNAYEWDQDRIERDVKPTVVSITKHTEIPFEGASVGEFVATGTFSFFEDTLTMTFCVMITHTLYLPLTKYINTAGFVVSKKYGLVATNKHVSGTSPSYFQVSFYDGTVRDATVLWYDPMEDFAFLRVEPSESLREVNLAEPGGMQAGDDVLLVGNNEGRDFSIKTGQIASMFRTSSSKRNLFWQTTFDRTGGASGSPVFNSDFEVVAIHAMGSDTTSMELPIPLLSRVLRTILQELESSSRVEVKRGDVGARFSLETVGNVARYYGMDAKEAEAESKRQMTILRGRRSGSPPCVPVVVSIVPGATSKEGLQPGDVILKAGGQDIGCDLSVLADSVDKVLSQKDHKVKFDVFRLGKKLSLDVNVNDAEEHKIDRFLQIAGAVFHEVTPNLRLQYVGALEGVWLAYASPGSAFDALGISEDDHPGYVHVLIQGISGKPVRNLDQFSSLLEPVLSRQGGSHRSQDIFVTEIDYKMDDLYSRAIPMSVESSSGNFEWNYDRTSRTWKKSELGSGSSSSVGSGGVASKQNNDQEEREESSKKNHMKSSSSSSVKVFRSQHGGSSPGEVIVEAAAKSSIQKKSALLTSQAT